MVNKPAARGLYGYSSGYWGVVVVASHFDMFGDHAAHQTNNWGTSASMIGNTKVPTVYSSGIFSCTRLLSHRAALLYTLHLNMPTTLPRSRSRFPNKVGFMRALNSLPTHVVAMVIMINSNTNTTYGSIFCWSGYHFVQHATAVSRSLMLPSTASTKAPIEKISKTSPFLKPL